jgi:hypothetical protein
MRHFAMLFILLFAASVDKPQVLAQESSIQERTGQSSAQYSQQEPFQAYVLGSFLPEAAVRADEQNQPYNAANDSLYRWYLRATIVGVFVALGGLGMLWIQSRHLQSQIRLQERGQRQWVNTSDWKAGLTTDSNGNFFATISCAISNVTHAPITLILIRLASENHKGISTDEGFPQNTLLLPNNPIRHNCLAPLTEDEIDAFTHLGLLFKLSGMIVYTDALEDTWTQSFRLTLVASPTSVGVGNYFHTLGKVRKVEMWQPGSGRKFRNVELPIPLWRKAIDWYVAQVEAMKNGQSENE